MKSLILGSPEHLKAHDNYIINSADEEDDVDYVKLYWDDGDRKYEAWKDSQIN